MAGNFNISYVFNARDNFTRVGRRIADSISSIGSASQPAVSRLRQLQQSLRQTAQSVITRAGPRIAAVIRSIGTASQAAVVRVRQLQQSLRQAAQTARQSFRNISASARSAGTTMSVAVSLPLVLLANKFVQAASEAAETASKFKTTFRDIGDSAEEAATKLSKNFILTRTDAKKLLAGTGDLLTGFQFSQKSALSLSVQVQELAADLASFNNLEGGTVRASDAITKGLLGETEGLKALGVVINQDLIKKKILQKEAEGVVFETLQQAKAIATLALIVEQSGNAIGDVSRTSKDFANLQRTMNNRLKDTSETLGVILMPFAIKLVTVVAKLAEKFNNLSPFIKKIILVTGALLAVIGPLLLLFAGITFVLGTISIPIIIAIAVIAALIVAFVSIEENWVEVSNVIGGTIEQIIINFNELKNKIVSSITATAEKISTVFNSIRETILNVINAIGDKINAFISGPIDLLKNVISTAKGLFGLGGESKLKITNKEIKEIATKSITPLEGSTLPTGDNLNARENRVAVDNNLNVTVAAEKGTQAKAVRGTKGNGMRLGTTMEPAF